MQPTFTLTNTTTQQTQTLTAQDLQHYPQPIIPSDLWNLVDANHTNAQFEPVEGFNNLSPQYHLDGSTIIDEINLYLEYENEELWEMIPDYIDSEQKLEKISDTLDKLSLIVTEEDELEKALINKRLTENSEKETFWERDGDLPEEEIIHETCEKGSSFKFETVQEKEDKTETTIILTRTNTHLTPKSCIGSLLSLGITPEEIADAWYKNKHKKAHKPNNKTPRTIANAATWAVSGLREEFLKEYGV